MNENKNKQKDDSKLKKRDIHFAEIGRIPPHNKDAEEAVIGACMLYSNAIDKVNWLKSEEFYFEDNRIVFEAISSINKENRHLDMITVAEEVKRVSPGFLMSDVMAKTKKVANDLHLKDHANIVRKTYNQRRLIQMSYNVLDYAYDASRTYDEVLAYTDEQLSSIQGADMKYISTIKDAVISTLKDIKMRISGERSTQLFTGWNKFDANICLQTNQIVVVAADKSVGKSQLVIAMMRGIFRNHRKEVAAQWYTMEEPASKMIYMTVADKVDLTYKQMTSVNYDLKEEEVDKIENACNGLLDMNVEFIDKKQSIDEIIQKGKNFCKRYDGKMPIIIVDNLGLIDCKVKGNSNERDDYIANKFVELRDLTGALIIIVHHMTKAVREQGSINTAYRPREEMIRGSSRIIDYANVCLLANYPYKYNDLAEEQMKKHSINKSDLSVFNKQKFEEHLWSINKNGDKETREKKISDLFHTTYQVVTSAIQNREISFKELVQKYSDYFIPVNAANQERDERWKKDPTSLLMFVKDKLYNNEFKSSNKKEEYMYGTMPEEERIDYLQNLFILESTKNRNEDITNDKIIRFYTDLNYNRFKELNY